jgi:hypothetical protein
LQLEWVEAAQLVAVVQLTPLVLVLPALLVRVPHYSLAQTAVLVQGQVQAHCLLPDVVQHSVQEQVRVQRDH